LFCFILAIFFSSFYFIPSLVGVFLIFLGFAVILGERLHQGKIAQEVFLVFLILFSFGLGSLRYAVKDFHIPESFFANQVGEKVSFEGIVVSEPERKDLNTRFVVSSQNERVLVSTDLYSPIEYGDKINVSGKLQEPELIEGDNGRIFNYPQYLAKDGIYYTVSFAKVEIISNGHGNWLKSSLYGIKRSFVGKIKEILSEPEASLLSGLIVSGKDAMPAGILEEFRRAGVVHIVVLSGFNITIIADFIRKFFEKTFSRIHSLGQLGPRLAAGISVFGIIAFILMTGAEPTVMRAGLMVLAVVAGKIFGRTYSASRALLAAAFLMILQNPKILVFDRSFQLSFLATLALIHVAPIAEKYLRWVTEKWGMRTLVATTIATQIVVLPFLVYAMGNFSVVSLPANILVLPIIPATMLLGFLAGIVAYANAYIALPISFLAHILLSWILGVSSFLGNLPLASVSVHSFSIWVMFFVYGLLFIVWKHLRSSVPRSSN
ncbi:MAG: ComEC/Rec2 family competence protein, partial [Patescibacteria group bacterium]